MKTETPFPSIFETHTFLSFFLSVGLSTSLSLSGESNPCFRRSNSRETSTLSRNAFLVKFTNMLLSESTKLANKPLKGIKIVQ